VKKRYSKEIIRTLGMVLLVLLLLLLLDLVNNVIQIPASKYISKGHILEIIHALDKGNIYFNVCYTMFVCLFVCFSARGSCTLNAPVRRPCAHPPVRRHGTGRAAAAGRRSSSFSSRAAPSLERLLCFHRCIRNNKT